MNGVSSAEKYAELGAAGLERPTCECHKEPMYWQKDARPRKGHGGYWVCFVGKREYARRFSQSEREREKSKKRSEKWIASNRLRRSQYMTLYQARRALERSIRNADLQY